MPTEIFLIKPAEIETKSFEIIENEFFQQTGRQVEEFPADQFAVIRRVIHATGDFSFAHNLCFHPDAISTAQQTLNEGNNVITDVRMGAVGMNQKILNKWGGKIICNIADPEIAKQAAAQDATRSETAILTALHDKPGIVAIGNAPTALLTIMKQCNNPLAKKPALIVGVPVGYVNAAESKSILAQKEYPFITSLGRKGGSPVAAAIVNALMKLADQ